MLLFIVLCLAEFVHCGLLVGCLAKDYSQFGSGRGLYGPTVMYLLIFVKSIKQSRPHILIHENVTAFPIELIISLLAGQKPTFHTII